MLARKLLSGAKAVEPVFVEDVFSVFTYTGNGSTQTINNGIDLAGKGGLVWIKDRSDGSKANVMLDSNRSNFSKLLSSSGDINNYGLSNGAQQNFAFGSFSATSLGFSVTRGSSNGIDTLINESAATYVSWTFAEQDKFFRELTVSHTNGTATNINLSALGTVGYVHAKTTGTTGDWIVWHRSLTAGNNLRLNTIAAQSTTDAWLSVSGTTATLSGSAPTGTYVIHAFAHNAGGFGLSGTENAISCGSYSGTGTTNFISLGWEPQWVLVKRTDSTGDWYLLDNMRGWITDSNVNAVLYANTSGNEEQSASGGWPAATGFYAGSGAYTSSTNTNGGTYIYIAIRRGPMRVPTSGASVFAPVTRTGTGSSTSFTTGFPADLTTSFNRAGLYYLPFVDRLRGFSKQLLTQLTNAEGTNTVGVTAMGNTSVSLGADTSFYYWNESGQSYINYAFRRAPGFFDVVCYTGTGGSSQTINHNLAVVPELAIFKSRNNINASGFEYWYTSGSVLGYGAGNAVALNLSNGKTWAGIDSATTTTITASSNNYILLNEIYVAYLFATCPGVSKVGSYTGTGTTLAINCGFTGGARFVLIKATSTTGDWLVWDVARGLVAGNDPYLALNSTAAEVTTTDWVDPQSAGFELSNASGNLANTNGVSYIFFAVA